MHQGRLLAKKNHAIWSKNEEIGLEIGGSGGAIFFEGDNNFDFLLFSITPGIH